MGNTEISTSDLARMLAASRRKAEGECVVCGKPITGLVFHGELARLYCSPGCKKAAYRARKKTERAASSDEDK